MDAGAESRIHPTQFGFRSGHGTMDAIFLARRLVDANALQRNPLILLALDWAKAFDSICQVALRNSLERFGLPAKFLETIRAVYSNRKFSVSDAGATSKFYQQHFGIWWDWHNRRNHLPNRPGIFFAESARYHLPNRPGKSEEE